MAFGILFRDKNLLAENIKKGVKILKVTGTCEGGRPINNQDITVDSSVVLQTFTAGEGYDGIGVFTLRPYNGEDITADSSTVAQVITPQTADCIWTVLVNPYVLDSKTVDSSTVSQTVTSSQDGLGSVTVNPYTLDSKTVDSSTVQQVVTSSADGLSSVTVNPYVLDTKTVDSSTISQTVNSSADGLSSVTVNPYVLDTKTVDSSTVQQVITSNEDGLSSVTVNPYVLDSKSLDPSTVSQTVNSSADGLSSVSVSAVTSSIDSNIQAGNIKNGVTILGVTGNLASGDWVAAAKKGTLTDLRSKSLAPHVTNRLNGYAYVFDHAVNAYRHFPSFTGTRTSVYIREYDHAFSNSKYWYHEAGDAWSKYTDFPFTYINQSGLKSFFENSQFNFESGKTTYIRFPNLTSIENSALDSAFKNAAYATNAVFPSLNLTGYSDYGMRSCFENFNTGGYYFTLDMPSLTNVTSHAMESICKGVAFMNLPAFLPNITNIGGYGMCESFMMNSASNYMTGAVNFTNLTSVNNYSFYRAFYNRTGLTSVSFPELTGSWQYTFCEAFYNCTGLTSVSFSKLTRISSTLSFYKAFANCTGLTSVSFPELTEISFNQSSHYMFSDCTNLATISFPKLAIFNPGLSISSAHIFSGTNITTATIHPGCLKGDAYNTNLLYNSAGLTSLTLSEYATDNIYLNWQSSLTAASVLDVLTHLDLNTSGKSVTFYSYGLTVTDDAQNSIQTAYDAAVNAGWTINNLTITAP